MNFLSKFLSNFTEEEKESELVRIMASIGVNMETSIMEAYNQDLQSSTELIYFQDNKLRSWLAYFLVRVPNYRSSVGSVELTINEATTQVSIRSGTKLKSVSGKFYEIQDSIVLSPGQTIALNVIQGSTESSEGIYNTIISIPASHVDITDLKVVVGGKTIPEVEELQGSVTPRDGYFAFVYEDTLYVKVYSGDKVEDPEGSNYSVTYRVSDGKSGNTGINTIDKFLDNLLDLNGNEVSYTLTNSIITGGRNEPEHYELVNLLRYKFFIHGSVASVPEYTIWYQAQSSVGDVLVQSDYERWLSSRKSDPSATIDITGIVKVYLLDDDGNPMMADAILNLETNLSKIRDIAVIRYEDPKPVLFHFKVQYTGSSNDALFQQNARSIISNFFNIVYLKNNGLSTFQDLDTVLLYEQLSNLYSVSGLNLVPYHFKEIDVTTYITSMSISFYNDEVTGGYYEILSQNDEGEYELVDTLYEVDGPAFCDIQKSDGTSVGSRGSNNVSIQWAFQPGMKVKCYWPLKNPGYLTIGSPSSFRKLGGVEFEIIR